jgi:hypothetical protein
MMETLFKKPEIQRDENGRFDRHGKTLAKTAKKKKPANNSVAIRETQFKPGQSGNPAGRPKGIPNKTTTALKQMILNALDKAGGEDYLARLAIENSSAFSSLIGKVLPATLTTDPDSGDHKIVFERVIVHADGHREIEGKTPKQLPRPAEPIAMPPPKLSEAAELYDDTEEQIEGSPIDQK